MATFSVNYRAEFYQGLFDHYVDGKTTYTSNVNVFGDIVTTASTSREALGYERYTNYKIYGELSFTTDRPIKYIYIDLLLCNRVDDVIGVEKYSWMGPFNGSGTFDLYRMFGEGWGTDVTHIRVRSVRCDFMDGTSEEAVFDLCAKVNVLKLETPKDRNALEEPSLSTIIPINVFLTPFGGIAYSIYKLAKGYKKSGKYYLKFSSIFLAVELAAILLTM